MIDIDERVDEMTEGKHARREGHPIDACPHGPGTSLGNAWKDGWRGEDIAIQRRKIRDNQSTEASARRAAH